MSGAKDRRDETGSGGSSDGDTQPDDTGATGTLADHPTAHEPRADADDEATANPAG